MALGTAVAADIADALLSFYVKGKAMAQNIQERPLLRWLESGKKTFPGGKDYVVNNVQGDWMSTVAGSQAFFAGYSEESQLAFKQAANIKATKYPWAEVHGGLVITETELKKNGVSVTDDMKTSSHSDAEAVRITDLLENRLADFGESWARNMNLMFWKDGSQDALQLQGGIKAILTDTPTAGTTGTLARTNLWWRHRFETNLGTSPSAQTLTKKMRHELIQLRRYGGRPNKALCGSEFWDALSEELTEKGVYTQEGFVKTNDLGVTTIRMAGLGDFEYDPTLDDLGEAKRCYVMDGRRIKLRPMEGEDTKIRNPKRPYDYFIFLRSMTWTGAMECTQLNANGVYAIA